MSQITQKQIENWFPQNLQQVAGCTAAVRYFTTLLKSEAEVGSNTLLVGASRTGKTAIVKAYLRSLMCGNRDAQTQMPCESCASCLRFNPEDCQHMLFAEFQARHSHFGKLPVNAAWIDCTKQSASSLEEHISGIRDSYGLKFVFLDEVHGLQENGLAAKVLVPLNDIPAMWIAATNEPKVLKDAFLHRFLMKFSLSSPSVAQLTEFIRQRCDEWKIAIDDPLKTPERLALKSRLMVTASLSGLAQAVEENDCQLTEQVVNQLRYFLDDAVDEDA